MLLIPRLSFSMAWDNKFGICVVVQLHSILYAIRMMENCIKECAMALESLIMRTVRAMKENGSTTLKVERYVLMSCI